MRRAAAREQPSDRAPRRDVGRGQGSGLRNPRRVILDHPCLDHIRLARYARRLRLSGLRFWWLGRGARARRRALGCLRFASAGGVAKPETVAAGALAVGGAALRWALARHGGAVARVVANETEGEFDFSSGLSSRRLIARHLGATVARRALADCLLEIQEPHSPSENAATEYVADLRWFRARFGYAARELLRPGTVFMNAARLRSRAVVAELLRWGVWSPRELHGAMDGVCEELDWSRDAFGLFVAAAPSYAAEIASGEWLRARLRERRLDLVAYCVDGSLAALAALGTLATPRWLERQLRWEGAVDIARFCLARLPVASDQRPVLARAALERYVTGAPLPLDEFDEPGPDPVGLAAFASEQLELYAAGV
jgi:hypothetical protein